VNIYVDTSVWTSVGAYGTSQAYNRLGSQQLNNGNITACVLFLDAS